MFVHSSNVKLMDHEFEQLSSFIYSNVGITLPPKKKLLLEGRLQRRLKATKIDSFRNYLKFIFSKHGSAEVINMIDRISTNKTDFFREPHHFEYFNDHILPEFERNSSGQLKIWSSAASSGEEVYTIAMQTEEYIRKNCTQLDYSILGSDISVEILNRAINAVYTEDRVVNIPYELKHRYFMKCKNKSKKLVRISPQLRGKVKFQRLNLMDNSYNVEKDFDVIFCRNVLIYFDRKTQEEVIRKQCNKLKEGGCFFLGHSESILGMQLPLKQINSTIYRKI
jgi:chemotaxis protein methyltransferase CheR